MTKTSRMTRAHLQILLSLAVEDRHGYAIKLDVESRTGRSVRLGSGTLYEGIQRLQASGWIEGVDPEGVDQARGRKAYRITPEGRRILVEELGRLEETVEYARRHRLIPNPGSA